MTSNEHQRSTRRRALKALGASVLISGLAGCSGDDGGDTDGGDIEGSNGGSDSDGNNDDTGGGDDTDGGSADGDTGGTASGSQGDSGSESGGEFVQESMGSVGRDDISELELVAWESEVTDIEFNVRVAVRNNGDEQANAREYTFEIVPFDESGTELDVTGTSVAYEGQKTEMAPGGVGSVVVTPAMDADPGTVASYEVNLHCDGPFAEGVYCSG